MNILQTIRYYIDYYTLQEPSTKRIILTLLLISLLFVATSCTVDYRTDEERASGVVLSEETIANREFGRQERLRLESEAAAEKRWRDAINRCGFDGQPLVICL